MKPVGFYIGCWLSALAMAIIGGMIAKYGFVDTGQSTMSQFANIVWFGNSILLSVGGFLVVRYSVMQ